MYCAGKTLQRVWQSLVHLKQFKAINNFELIIFGGALDYQEVVGKLNTEFNY